MGLGAAGGDTSTHVRAVGARPRDVLETELLEAHDAGVLDAEYVLPLRWERDDDLAELTAYLRDLAGHVPVTVVDGSPPARFAAHAGAWGTTVRHVRPAP
ncbi:hypothetical protein HGA02_20245, partial [Cellulomonas septica]|nr:hypothetical protein [Cellulomonas septica]